MFVMQRVLSLSGSPARPPLGAPAGQVSVIFTGFLTAPSNSSGIYNLGGGGGGGGCAGAGAGCAGARAVAEAWTAVTEKRNPG